MIRARHSASALLLAFLVSSLASVPPAAADTVVIPPAHDATLYGDDPDIGNGAGDHLFSGRTDRGDRRRALLSFDVAGNVPPGSTIDAVTLELYMSRTRSGTGRTTTLHRLLASWGEGPSDAFGEEGGGTLAADGDATWTFRFFPTDPWSSGGGDHAATASASTSVGGEGTYGWSSAGMVEDVQEWLDTPSTNFGWIVIGQEGSDATAKRFESRSFPDPLRRPRLTIDYTPSGIVAGACCLPDGSCILLTPADCAAQSGTYQGDGTTCTSDPCLGVPVTIVIEPSKDNTLYRDENGALSNGAGEYFFAGMTADLVPRRAVLAFDLAAHLPPGSVVSDATLTLRKTFGGSAAHDVRLHRALADWGEGASDAAGDESAGAPSEPGDATWVHTFHPTDLWAAPGGDYDPTPSATTYVAFEQFYEWSGPGMVEDLQAWVDDPGQNFGWVVVGKETGTVITEKRYVSRENAQVEYRPKLEITYSVPPPPPTGACCLPDAPCEVRTAAECAADGGDYQGQDTVCGPNVCPVFLEPYVDPLPLPSIAVPVSGVPGGAAHYEIPIVEIEQQLHRDLPPTTLWTYEGQYPGPTIEAAVGEPVSVTWVSDLRDSTGALRTTHLLPVDLCMHGPDHMGPTPRTVVHLHGGHVESESDGQPEDTILPGEEQTFFYPNQQEPSLIWYHDHALGITRLNVILGLAGLYVIRDDTEAALGLPDGPYEVPLAIADRSFHPDGSLAYPESWEEHFFGDKILVNGKVWPHLEVDRGAYRFRILNGSNSRTLDLSLSNGASFFVLGGDGGLLPRPVVRQSLLLTPAERMDVIVDFSAEAPGTEILLENRAPAPYPDESPAQPQVPEVMKFVVTAPAGFSWAAPDSLRPMERLLEEDATTSRDFLIQRYFDECAGSKWLINGLGWDDITERPLLGSTEIWRFINRSGMVHPMHMHLVMFQVLDIQPFTTVGDSIITTGPPVPPDSSLAGWKDTVPVLPNEMVRVIARFEDYTGLFPYHCHILEHEDHEMMRQFEVVDTLATDLEPIELGAGFRVLPSRPNPAFEEVELRFQLPERAETRIEVFDVAGRLVATPLDRTLEPGLHSLRWSGEDGAGRRLAPGVYFYRVVVPGRERPAAKILLLD